MKQDKIKSVPLARMIWRFFFYLSSCVEIMNLSMSSLWPAAPGEVAKLVLSEVSWAKAACPMQSSRELGRGYKIYPRGCINTRGARGSLCLWELVEGSG